MRRVVFKVRFLWFVVFAVVAGVWPLAAQAAATSPVLGSAAGFAVLAGSAVTCTTSTITGDVGVSPDAVVTRTTCPINGTVHANDTAAINANSAFHTAYALGLGSCDTTWDATASGVTTVASGTYCTPDALTFTNRTLSLTGTGPWNFEIGIGPSGVGALTTTNLKVVMAPGGNPCNVFWWVRDDVSLKATTTASTPFLGTILAGGAITLVGTASNRSALTLTGRAWASGQEGSALTPVTMTDSTIVGCTAAGTVPVTKCKKGGDNDEDKDADKSKDAADRNGSVKGATSGASNSSHDDGNKGCDSGKPDKDKSDKDKSDKDKSDKDKSDKDKSDKDKKSE
jgi:hypothetical protein